MRKIANIKNGRGEVTGKIEMIWSDTWKMWMTIPRDDDEEQSAAEKSCEKPDEK